MRLAWWALYAWSMVMVAAGELQVLVRYLVVSHSVIATVATVLDQTVDQTIQLLSKFAMMCLAGETCGGELMTFSSCH